MITSSNPAVLAQGSFTIPANTDNADCSPDEGGQCESNADADGFGQWGQRRRGPDGRSASIELRGGKSCGGKRKESAILAERNAQ